MQLRYHNGGINMNEVYDFLEKCEVYFLATIDGSQPRVRPLGTIDIFEDRLYIQMGKIKNVSKQMMINPNIEICALSEGNWLRIAATAVEDDRREAKQHMLDKYPMLQKMYSADDGNTQVWYLKDATATFSSISGESRTLTF